MNNNLAIAQSFFNKAIQLHDENKLEEAIKQYLVVIKTYPAFGMAYSNLGVILQGMERYDEALEIYSKGVSIVQDYAELHYNYGVLLHHLNKIDEAIISYDKVTEIDPTYITAYNNRGVILHNLEQYDEALKNFNKALDINPNYENAYFNRGNVYAEKRLWELALTDYNKAIELSPTFFDAHFNKANTLREVKQFEEAYELYEFVTNNIPVLDEAHWNKSYVKLIQGDYELGFKYYEYRWEYRKMKAIIRNFKQPKWLGQTSIAGKTLFIYPEQGFGDSLQFFRYIPLVVQLGATVIIAVNKELLGVIPNYENVTIITDDDSLPDFDYHIPLMSLAMVFKTTINTIPAKIPYLSIDDDKKKFWADKLGTKTKPRIGLVWSGGFRTTEPDTWQMNERRNIKLSLLKELNSVDVEYYSLQKGPDSEAQLKELKDNNWGGPTIIDYSSEFNSFADTGGLIEQLDLVIAVDTSTAHLAAALGKPVWLFNRYDGCWRWHHNRTDSPWYPTVTIFNQQIEGEWEPVIQEVVAKLKTMW